MMLAVAASSKQPNQPSGAKSLHQRRGSEVQAAVETEIQQMYDMVVWEYIYSSDLKRALADGNSDQKPNVDNANKRPRGECYKFKRGECTFGANCRSILSYFR